MLKDTGRFLGMGKTSLLPFINFWAIKTLVNPKETSQQLQQLITDRAVVQLFGLVVFAITKIGFATAPQQHCHIKALSIQSSSYSGVSPTL